MDAGRLVQFVAVDVETANADLASICQVGIVAFDLSGPVSTWQSLVNPEDFFDPVNPTFRTSRS
jgi:DNA polymerase-3 subunit epsilon